MIKQARTTFLLLIILMTGCATYETFSVNTDPPSAEIFVDGKLMGKTPATIKVEFPEDKQLVREKKIIALRLRGYKEVKDLLTYEENIKKVLNFKLVSELKEATATEAAQTPTADSGKSPIKKSLSTDAAKQH